MVNKVMLIGNLGQDPEVRHLESGAVVAKFSLATNERYKDKSGEVKTLTEWHDVVMWRGLAENAERLLSKGKLIYVEGKLSHRKWQDKEGNNRKTTEVLANNFQILEKREQSDSGYDTSNSASTSLNAAGKAADAPANKSVVESQKSSTPSLDDDLPF